MSASFQQWLMELKQKHDFMVEDHGLHTVSLKVVGRLMWLLGQILGFRVLNLVIP